MAMTVTAPLNHPAAHDADDDRDAGQLDAGQLDLDDRHALRRIAGLSTELEDVSEVEYRALRLERVVLMGVWTEGTAADAEHSLRELSQLAETAGSEVLDGLIQRRSRPDSATFVGAGKAAELAEVVAAVGADTVICDGELAPGQLRKLESITKVKVIDRTALILDIFAQHARSKEGKAQVELAQLQYMMPRLRGWGESLSRQAGGRAGGAGGGGIGTRGPGETKIETDRRRIRTRISRLRKEIAEMSAGREVQRGQRRRGQVPSVAIAGYTNAGKSSLLNRLTGAQVLVDNSLFATLDPAVRRARTPQGLPFTLTDTVGFVRHLPHQLVDAFRSTLEEVAEADVILHVVDASDADPRAQLAAVREVLGEIGARQVPELVVINKADAADPIDIEGLRLAEPKSVVVSAVTGEGIDKLLAELDEMLPRRQREITVTLPYERGDLVSRAHREGEVLEVRHGADGTELTARVPLGLAAELDPFAVAAPVR
jgi:GTP-binding protein HflX